MFAAWPLVVACSLLRSTAASGVAPARDAETERVARADAAAQLQRAVCRHITTDCAAGEALRTSSAVAAEVVAELVRQAQPAGEPTWYRDGVCEVHLLLSHAALTAELDRLSPAGESPAAKAARPAPCPAAFLAGGCAGPAGEGSPALTAGGELPRTALEQAAAAARLDARLALLEEVRRLRVRPAVNDDGARSLTVADVLADEPRLAWTLHQSDWPIRYGAARCASDLRCLVTAELDVNAAAGVLREEISRHYRGTLCSPDEMRDLARCNAASVLRALGSGTPPAVPGTQTEVRTPAWVDGCLVAVGTAPLARERGAAAADALASATREAAFDAEYRLALQIDDLLLPDGRRLGPLIRAHCELSEDLSVYLGGVRRLGQPVEDGQRGVVRVTVGLPARRLWQLVRPLSR